MTKEEARNICWPEAFETLEHWHIPQLLPVPQSDEENEQIAKLSENNSIWLDITSGYKRWLQSGTQEWEYFDRWSSPAWPRLNVEYYKNWRSNNGVPAASSSDKNTFAILSASDGKWITADENETHFAVCIYRIGETVQTSTPIKYPESISTTERDIKVLPTKVLLQPEVLDNITSLLLNLYPIFQSHQVLIQLIHQLVESLWPGVLLTH